MASKHVLSDVCEVVRRSDIFHIDPTNIRIVKGWNARTDFDGEDELVASIKEQGVIEPLQVRKSHQKDLELVSGERRLRATLRAISEGSEIKSVPVIVVKRGTNQAELFIKDLCSNNGKPLTPNEEAGAFKRLVNWGYSVQDISTQTGKSVSHVRNRIELSNAGNELKESIDKGEVTITDAQEIVKKSGGDIEKQRDALKKKATSSKIRGFVFKAGDQRKDKCKPIEDILESEEFLGAVENAGFDILTLKISIKPVKGQEAS